MGETCLRTGPAKRATLMPSVNTPGSPLENKRAAQRRADPRRAQICLQTRTEQRDQVGRGHSLLTGPRSMPRAFTSWARATRSPRLVSGSGSTRFSLPTKARRNEVCYSRRFCPTAQESPGISSRGLPAAFPSLRREHASNSCSSISPQHTHTPNLASRKEGKDPFIALGFGLSSKE